MFLALEPALVLFLRVGVLFHYCRIAPFFSAFNPPEMLNIMYEVSTNG
mgnify:CR=1 FL=1